MDKEFLYEEYIVKQKSSVIIAKENHSSSTQVVRLLKKYGIPVRTNSQSQQVALKTGVKPHPTKGRKRTQAEKTKIADKVYNQWKTKTPEERAKISANAKERWDNMPERDREEFMKKAHSAIRCSSVAGSKLEHFIYNGLLERGYAVDFHKEGLIANHNLQIDMFVSSHHVAIEIDGPSHFLPIWGEENLIKNRKADQEKNGLILTSGFAIIRTKQLTKTVSNKRMEILLDKICEKLDSIQRHFPPMQERLIEIEV